MRILVTGAGGFVGRHVLRELADNGHTPLALDCRFGDSLPPGTDTVTEADVTNAADIRAAVKSLAPEACIHLAGIAFVPDGASAPGLMFEVNVMGTLYLLEAVKAETPEAKVLVVSSGHVYGDCNMSRPVTEADPLAPLSRYAISKLAADLMTLNYAHDCSMKAVTVRPYNHIGPGQSPRFVVASFADQLKKIAAGEAEARMMVGNLDAERDFTDVRDVARAYRLLLEQGRDGEAYNVASGRPVAIRAILEMLSKIAGVSPEIVVDPERYRPADNSASLDTSKIEQDTGWQPCISLEQSLQDLYAAV